MRTQGSPIRRLPGPVAASAAAHATVFFVLLASATTAPSAALDREAWVTFEASAPPAARTTPEPDRPVPPRQHRPRRRAREAPPSPTEPEPETTVPPASTPSSRIPENPFATSGVDSVVGGLRVTAAGAQGPGPFALRPAVLAPMGHAPVDERAALRRWMRAVNAVIRERAARNYPRSAKRSGQEGTVLVDIVVTERGRIDLVRLRRSSGYASLDRAALAAVHGVASLPAPPDAYMRRGRPLRMPIAYRVQ